MKLKRLDRKILGFAHPLQIKPGFTKRKSLLHYLEVDEDELDQSISRLEAYKLLKITDKNTSHSGVCYELTDLGIITASDLNKSLFQTIKENKLTTVLVAILAYLITYFMDLFSEEIKAAILCFFD